MKRVFLTVLHNYRKLMPMVLLITLVAVSSATDVFSSGVHQALRKAFVEYFNKMLPMAIDLMVAGILFNIAWLFYKPLCNGTEKVLQKTGASPRAQELSLKLLKFFYWAFALFFVFSMTASDLLGRLAIGFGVFGAALTLALQGAANDFICGLLIQFTRKVAVADPIKVEGIEVEGIITNVGYLSTNVESETAFIKVPNREIWSRAVKVIKPAGSSIILAPGSEVPGKDTRRTTSTVG